MLGHEACRPHATTSKDLCSAAGQLALYKLHPRQEFQQIDGEHVAELKG